VGCGRRLRWGLYGTFNYLSPGIFRVSSTALSIGTTAQQRFSEGVALQGSALGGVGFGAAGTVADDETDRDYHYGAIPQAAIDLRLVLGDAVLLEVEGREFFVVGGGFDDNRGSENITQGKVGMVVRLGGPHALTAHYVVSSRHAHYEDDLDRDQTVGSFFLTYSFLGRTRFGVVE
jgi:hypothetical protein